MGNVWWEIGAIVAAYVSGYIVATWRCAGEVVNSQTRRMIAEERADKAEEETVRLRAARDMDEWLRD